MVRKASLVALLVVATVMSTFVALHAATQREAIESARATYDEGVAALLGCLAESGYDARATQGPSGIFYDIEVDFAPASSASAWSVSESEYMRALDACTSEDLLAATVDLEALTRPSEEEARAIADKCDGSGESARWAKDHREASVEDIVTEVASTGQEAARCIVAAMNEHARSVINS